jgi:hypothetical protein
VVPYELHFKNTLDVENLENRLNWYTHMKDIPAGTNLFEVWAWTKPQECGGIYEKIADIELQTKLYTSEAGDNRLFF